MMKRRLQHPEKWNVTKFVTWPHSWKNPMVRVPEKDGGYRSFSVRPKPSESEVDLLERCRTLRDAIGVPIWGEEKWWNILRFPARSSARPRKNPHTPHNGVSLIERPNTAAYYSASWYEADPEQDSTKESQTHGKRVPRKKRQKSFSFGTPNAGFCTEEEALKAAIAFIQDKQSKVYVLTG